MPRIEAVWDWERSQCSLCHWQVRAHLASPGWNLEAEDSLEPSQSRQGPLEGAKNNGVPLSGSLCRIRDLCKDKTLREMVQMRNWEDESLSEAKPSKETDCWIAACRRLGPKLCSLVLPAGPLLPTSAGRGCH